MPIKQDQNVYQGQLILTTDISNEMKRCHSMMVEFFLPNKLIEFYFEKEQKKRESINVH